LEVQISNGWYSMVDGIAQGLIGAKLVCKQSATLRLMAGFIKLAQNEDRVEGGLAAQ
jgi:hypothetical protein